MGLFSFFTDWSNEIQEEDRRKDRIELEKEMDYRGLTEEEKELVRKGDYEPWNFEYPEDNDDLEDDDYYSEDN